MSEWGPWIEHDGKGCPCVGQYVNAISHPFGEWFGIAGSEGGETWDDRNKDWAGYILCYRIRKPRGMGILQEIVKNPEREMEDA